MISNQQKTQCLQIDLRLKNRQKCYTLTRHTLQPYKPIVKEQSRGKLSLSIRRAISRGLHEF